jgi:membrane dipeptidase
LTPFGKDVVRRCFALGIIPDISHTCKQSAQDTLDLAIQYEKPVIASHSNSYTTYPHTRNLRDEHFGIIRDLGGLVGLNFYRAHLRDCSEHNATVSDLVRHLEYFLSLGGENTVAIGGDWDGAQLPDGFSTVADVRILQDELLRLGYDHELIDKLFWKNAYDFIHRAFV